MERVLLAEMHSQLKQAIDATSRALDSIDSVMTDEVSAAYALFQLERATEWLREVRVKCECCLNRHAMQAAVRRHDLEEEEIRLDP